LSENQTPQWWTKICLDCWLNWYRFVSAHALNRQFRCVAISLAWLSRWRICSFFDQHHDTTLCDAFVVTPAARTGRSGVRSASLIRSPWLASRPNPDPRTQSAPNEYVNDRPRTCSKIAIHTRSVFYTVLFHSFHVITLFHGDHDDDDDDDDNGGYY